MYEYKGQIVRVVDGDTVHIDVDLGCNIGLTMTCRLNRINAPEMSTTEGVSSKKALSDLLSMYCVDDLCTVRTIKDKKEKYGRYLVELFGLSGGGIISEVNLNDLMVKNGFAVYKDYS